MGQADEALVKCTPIAEVDRDAFRRMKELDILILKEVAKGEF